MRDRAKGYPVKVLEDKLPGNEHVNARGKLEIIDWPIGLPPSFAKIKNCKQRAITRMTITNN